MNFLKLDYAHRVLFSIGPAKKWHGIGKAAALRKAGRIFTKFYKAVTARTPVSRISGDKWGQIYLLNNDGSIFGRSLPLAPATTE